VTGVIWASALLIPFNSAVCEIPKVRIQRAGSTGEESAGVLGRGFTSALYGKNTWRGCCAGRASRLEAAEDDRVFLEGNEVILLGVDRGGAEGEETVAGVGEF